MAKKFQSTHPHGVRLLGPYLDYPFVACFNPRTHTGCDGIMRLSFKDKMSFNPRTHTGCDIRVLKM